MPITVQQLIEGRQKPVTVSPNASIKRAVEVMIEHNYSQLPVIEEDGRVVGIVTSESILRALYNFGVSTNELTVSDAMRKMEPKRSEDDLFNVLDDLRDSFAVLVADAEGKLAGIITSFDTTEYFRQRIEDIMQVEDIEGYLKDYVRDALKNDNGEIDQAALDTAIQEITPSNKDVQKRFRRALCHYLELQGEARPQLDQKHFEKAFSQHLEQREPPRPFDKLTIHDYIELFLHKSRWSNYQPLFAVDPKAIRKLLESVRETRNDLAHFRNISANQSDQLQFCRDWFARQQSTHAATFQTQQTISASLIPTIDNQKVTGQSSTLDQKTGQSVDESIALRDSRFAPLSDKLQQVSANTYKLKLKFGEIENIIEGRLPISARQHRLWWANDPNNPQALQWLDAGWCVSSVSTYDEEVTFERIKGAGRAYIDFYNDLLTELQQSAPFELRDVSPSGSSWLTVANLSMGATLIGFLGFSFTRSKPFRIELRIYSGDTGKDEQLFNSLYSRKGEIESELKTRLEWEHEKALDQPRWNVSMYFDGPAITATDDQLREWAVTNVNRFYEVFAGRLNEAWSAIEEGGGD